MLKKLIGCIKRFVNKIYDSMIEKLSNVKENAKKETTKNLCSNVGKILCVVNVAANNILDSIVDNDIVYILTILAAFKVIPVSMIVKYLIIAQVYYFGKSSFKVELEA